MAYAESESMALKRLKVALKRKDWQMFEYGLNRISDLINAGSKLSEIQDWYKILDAAKAEKIPEDLLKRLSNLIENLLSPSITTQTHAPGPTETSDTDSQAYKTTTITQITKVKAPEIPFVIFIDSEVSIEQNQIVKQLRNCLTQLSIDPDYKIDPKLLSNVSKLLKSLDKTSQELKGLETLLQSYPEPGIIITATYDSEIIKILNKYNVDYSIDEIKKPQTDKHWKVYPLFGLTSILYCPTCGTKTFYKNFACNVVGICKKCSSAAFPDINPIDNTNPQVNPKTWYMAYQTLVKAANWLIISPPSAAEKPIISRLITETCSDTAVNNTYIVSDKSDIGSWWRNKLEESISDCNVAPVCFNVEILLNNYIKLPEIPTND